MKSFSDLFKCCCRGGQESCKMTNKYVESNDSIDNLSMISVTYGLESFTKNAMVIFCQVTSELGSRSRELTITQAAALKDSFQKYRFEVETHIDLNSTEVEEKCDEFFGRDFSEYGAVVVVVLAPYGEFGTLAATDKLFQENVIVRHLTSDVPVTLRGKPRIYITEANRTNTSPMQHSVHIKDAFEDVLALHIPIVIEGARCPLQIFCNRMNQSGDHGNLIAIVIGALQEIDESFPQFQENIELVCTLKKRFTLPMFVLIE